MASLGGIGGTLRSASTASKANSVGCGRRLSPHPRPCVRMAGRAAPTPPTVSSPHHPEGHPVCAVFVESLVSGGAADKTGLIKPGDVLARWGYLGEVVAVVMPWGRRGGRISIRPGV